MMSQSLVQSQVINESRDIIVVILLISMIPLLTQFPAVVAKILQMFLTPFNPWLVRSTVAMFPLTPASNPYITMYVVKDYRKKILKLLKKASPAVNPAGEAAPVHIRGSSFNRKHVSQAEAVL